MKPELGQFYTRDQIFEMVGGGSKQSYLPQKKGKILCGCFDPKLNSKAPYEIDAGDGPVVLNGAKLLAEGGYSIPVFLQKKSNQWEYVGDYICTGHSESPEDLYPKKQRRPDAVAVFFLKRIFESEEKAAAELLSQEGNRILRSHFIRERDPSLAAAKRRGFIEQYGILFCESCGTKETDFPKGLGQSCFEVHHLSPIGNREESQLTRLSDLAIVCANCHRMIHAHQAILSLDEIKFRLAQNISKVDCALVAFDHLSRKNHLTEKEILDLPREPRPIGLAKGQFTVPDNFNTPLSGDFEGK